MTSYGETSAVEEYVNVHARHCRIGKVTVKLVKLGHPVKSGFDALGALADYKAAIKRLNGPE